MYNLAESVAAKHSLLRFTVTVAATSALLTKLVAVNSVKAAGNKILHTPVHEAYLQ